MLRNTGSSNEVVILSGIIGMVFLRLPTYGVTYLLTESSHCTSQAETSALPPETPSGGAENSTEMRGIGSDTPSRSSSGAHQRIRRG